ncbi:MAG: hypothetical protein ACRBK7_14525 [Acidimicrobiales bacterium]
MEPTIDIQGRYVIFYHDGQNERIVCDSHEAAIGRAAEIEADLAANHERLVAQLHTGLAEGRDVTIPHVEDWERWRLCDDGSGKPVPCDPDPVPPVPPPVFVPDPGSPLVGGDNDEPDEGVDVGVFAGDANLDYPLNGAERPLPPPPAPAEPEPDGDSPEPVEAATGPLPTADGEWHPDSNRLSVTIVTASEVQMWRKFGDRPGDVFTAKPDGAPRHFKAKEPGERFELRLFNETGPMIYEFTAPES